MLSNNPTTDAAGSEPARELDALLRLTQVLAPGGPIPVSRATWYAWIAQGRAPKSVHVRGSPLAFWRASDIRRFVEEAGHE